MEESDGYEDPNMETLIGYLNYMPVAEMIVFSAKKYSGKIKNHYIDSFDDVLVNQGDSFSLSSGSFTAPVKGTFEFSFTGKFDSTNSQWNEILVLRNENDKMGRFGSYNKGTSSNVRFDGVVAFTLSKNLNKGDTIRLKVIYGMFYAKW